MDAPKGTLIAYSTSPGKVALDGSRRNSPYTEVLLKNIQVPDLTIEQVFKQTRKDIDILTTGKQTPWESTSLIGDFYFVSKRGIVVAQSLKAKSKNSSELEKEREKLERERQELERLKMEIEREKLTEERKRLKAEKKKIAIAKKEVGRDGTVIAYATGVVYDKKTGLEWVAGPDRDTTWNKAKRWVENLNVAGGGWRMPTITELKTLYKKGAGSRNMTPLLKTTGWWVWSGETKGSSSAWYFGFYLGNEYWGYRDRSYTPRCFAVRSRR